MNQKKIRLFLGGYVNFLNAQNINCRALSKHLDKTKFDIITLLHPKGNAGDFYEEPGVRYIKHFACPYLVQFEEKNNPLAQ